MNNKKNCVLIFQRVLPHYRHSFFKKLAESLKCNNVLMLLHYGFEKEGTVPKTCSLPASFTIESPVLYFNFFGVELVWQKFSFKDVLKADVVIVEQANRILSNYLLFLICLVFRKKFVFWGHGRNYQSKRASLLGNFKQFYTRFSSGFIAYTKDGRDYLIANGYKPKSAFFVNNSVDIQLFKSLHFSDSGTPLSLKNYNFPTTNMAVYCGGMYKHKRLNFLLDAAILIKKHISDFSLVLIGDGPDADLAINFANEHSDWVHYAGFLVGEEKSRIFSKAKLQFMPGLVGLAVIDSFVFEVPLVTTNIDYHSPEFEYIINGENGIVTDDSVNSYALTVVDYFNNEEKLLKLKHGCRVSSKIYTVDNMVVNFSNAILKIMDVNND